MTTNATHAFRVKFPQESDDFIEPSTGDTPIFDGLYPWFSTVSHGFSMSFSRDLPPRISARPAVLGYQLGSGTDAPESPSSCHARRGAARHRKPKGWDFLNRTPGF